MLTHWIPWGGHTMRKYHSYASKFKHMYIDSIMEVKLKTSTWPDKDILMHMVDLVDDKKGSSTCIKVNHDKILMFKTGIIQFQSSINVQVLKLRSTLTSVTKPGPDYKPKFVESQICVWHCMAETLMWPKNWAFIYSYLKHHVVWVTPSLYTV